MLHYLIYISRTSQSWSQQELLKLLEVSWSRNKLRNISGMLVFLGDRFIQLLEGTKEDVLNTLAKIEQDSRHADVNILLEGSHEERIFKSWSMGFKQIDLTDFEKITGFRDPTDFFADDHINNHSHPALIFLKLFYDKNYRDFIDQKLT